MTSNGDKTELTTHVQGNQNRLHLAVLMRMIGVAALHNQERNIMQSSMEMEPESDAPVCEPNKPPRIPIFSTNFYPLTVLCWVLSVAVVAILVGLVCTGFFANYTSLLGRLIGN